jgi:DNA repair exonuclease SbcCD ATPase subunit
MLLRLVLCVLLWPADYTGLVCVIFAWSLTASAVCPACTATRCCPVCLQRISRESAALLDRAGVDTAAEGDEEQIHMQQQQQQQLAAGVTDIAALSAMEQPLLGPAGSSQQQQQEDDEDEEELELSEDMAEMAELLQGITAANTVRERMEEALTTGGGGGQAK